MKKRNKLLVFLLALSSICYFRDPTYGQSVNTSPSISLLMPSYNDKKAMSGQYFGEQYLDGRDGPDEYGWIKELDGHEVMALCDGSLKETKVNVSQGNGPTNDEVEIKVIPACNATALFPDHSGLTIGKIIEAVIVEKIRLTKWDVNFQNQNYSVERRPVGQSGYKLVFISGGKSQLLHETPSLGDEGPIPTAGILIWAGDLNRDGKVDLLLQAPDDMHESVVRLFLSSSANNELHEESSLRVSGGGD